MLTVYVSISGANLLRDLGKVTMACEDDLDKAAQAFNDALNIRSRVGALNCPEAAKLIRDMGSLKRKQGDLVGAKKDLEAACYKMQSLGLEGAKDALEFSKELLAIENLIAESESTPGETSDE